MSVAATSPDASNLAQARRTTLIIAVAVGIGSMSFAFWYPFMPLYLLDIGATSEANALFWIAIATTVQGMCRFFTGPIWGVLSDRVGRKAMFLRALYFTAPTMLVAAVANAPWQITFSLAIQGLFSGFVPAAVALTSVSVPESQLGKSLGLVTGFQYLGSTIGPAAGAVLAALLGFRGAIFVGAALPAIAATGVLFYVPRDSTSQRAVKGQPKEKLEPFRPSRQLLLIIFFYFVIFAMTQLVQLATPIALKQIEDSHVSSVSGVAFTIGGLASAIAVLFIAPRFFVVGRQRRGLIVATVLAGVFYLLLALSNTVPLFIACFAVISLLQAAMIPATNTLIAANVSRARRGTGFGLAGSAQALAFIAGPMGAALFGAVSLDLGFLLLGGMLLACSGGLFLALKEPRYEDEVVIAPAGQPSQPVAEA